MVGVHRNSVRSQKCTVTGKIITSDVITVIEWHLEHQNKSTNLPVAQPSK